MDDMLFIRFGSPRQQSRVTVAFRGLLAIPHVVVLLGLTLVAIPLLVLGWLAALILGRLPGWIATYVMSLIAYSVRVHGYVVMLAGEFPPFSFSVAAEYPITARIEPAPLSRLKVLFRWLLIIPAAFVSVVVSFGLLILSPILWLLTLVLGRMPLSSFVAAAAAVRYVSRVSAYAYLVTDVYPRRLWGDDEYWDLAPEGFRLSVSKNAKLVIGVIVALGIATCIGGGVLRYETVWVQNPVIGAAEVQWEYHARNWEIERTNSPCKLACKEGYDRDLGNAFNQFASRVSRILAPASPLPVTALVREAGQIGQLLFVASKSKTVAGHRAAIDAIQLRVDAFARDAARVLGPSPDATDAIIK